ncbi:hypothetical protein DPMN_129954 [Dreissena polymorpha]|uniref:Uncharacterized protein n=1 Tax=Dreissena polymorpha TaxID=45954 RepID=A0A9D4JXX4_DREPO|nr:hypothetical protein DPMN_129954 [Dreissena polymorpha]
MMRYLMCMLVLTLLLSQVADVNSAGLCGRRRCPPGYRCVRFGSVFRCHGGQTFMHPGNTGNTDDAGK